MVLNCKTWSLEILAISPAIFEQQIYDMNLKELLGLPYGFWGVPFSIGCRTVKGSKQSSMAQELTSLLTQLDHFSVLANTYGKSTIHRVDSSPWKTMFFCCFLYVLWFCSADWNQNPTVLPWQLAEKFVIELGNMKKTKDSMRIRLDTDSYLFMFPIGT